MKMTRPWHDLPGPIDASGADEAGNLFHEQLGQLHIDRPDQATTDLDLKASDHDFVPTLEMYYQSLVQEAEGGDLSAIRTLFTTLHSHLSEPHRSKDDPITLYPVVRSFLARRIGEALNARQSEVGKILGLRRPSRTLGAGKLSKAKADFVDWYVQRASELGLTRNDLWANKWVTERDEVNAWVAQDNISRGDVSEKTVTEWRREARCRMW